MGASVALAPDLVAFYQSGVSVIIASCLPDGRPVSGLAFACRVLPTGTIRILLSPTTCEPLLQAVKQGGAFAATFTQPTTHRSIQVKAERAEVVSAGDEDLEAARLQCGRFCQELVEIGYAPAFSAAYCHQDASDMVAIDMEPGCAFVQTPGPGAGTELQP